jgi:hypothetical protein
LPRCEVSGGCPLEIAQKTSPLIGGKDIDEDDIVLNEDYAYPIYGVPSKETIEAVRLSARLEGMMTDPEFVNFLPDFRASSCFVHAIRCPSAPPIGHEKNRHLWRFSADFSWSGRRDSNPRPQPWQGCAG